MLFAGFILLPVSCVMHAYVCMLWMTHSWTALKEGFVTSLQHIHVWKPQHRVAGKVLSAVHVAQMAKHAGRSLRRKLAIQNNGGS